jgi:hypothetical protein
MTFVSCSIQPHASILSHRTSPLAYVATGVILERDDFESFVNRLTLCLQVKDTRLIQVDRATLSYAHKTPYQSWYPMQSPDN